VDADDPVESPIGEAEVAGRSSGFGGDALTPVLPAEAPANFDGGQDLRQEVRGVESSEPFPT
jgi:hypothetical protein